MKKENQEKLEKLYKKIRISLATSDNKNILVQKNMIKEGDEIIECHNIFVDNLVDFYHKGDEILMSINIL